jgi:hypothetical protein
MRIDCLKHFEEDDKFKDSYEVPYKTNRYVKKLKMREECHNLSVEQFLYSKDFESMNVWDLKYISTSDEEDNDSEQSEDEEEDEKEGKEEEKEETIWKG